ncbi:LysR substrate-binding domain-containing protein [Yoonia sp. I 8.24]|uniref:LysR substrate-binding domain-containing protein n=1 Tax=Yoonia sp. I 8.24 TaxID=1537229 RepID=UPI001EDF25FA|nr:LysR substrate-binding domain-containing protein [Yoonia sp. I 8.24]
MSQRPYNLPSMTALVSFEAAARHVSFKNAAVELNVTAAAISHQVKSLEADLQRPLFDRHHRGVELTETGAYLMVAIQRGFEGIDDAIGQLRARAPKAAVTIRATTAVSSLWLTPRLAQFWRAHGNISVAQIVSDTDQTQSDCDLSIHYGDITQETGICRALFHDQIMAFGSPSFAAKHRVETVADMAKIPLIHLDAPDTRWTNWQEWCGALGYHGPLQNTHQVNNYVIALQAAQDDMGAVLGWDGLSDALVTSGKLVKLLPSGVASPKGFYVKLHPRASGKARLVYDWLAGA